MCSMEVDSAAAALRRPARGRRLNSHSAVQDIPPQAPVAHQAEQGMFECRRLVVLEKEMTDPRKGVPLYESDRNEPPPARDHSGDEQCSGNAGPGEMQAPAGAVGVLAEIKGIEIAESAVRVSVAHYLGPSDVGRLRNGRHTTTRTRSRFR